MTYFYDIRRSFTDAEYALVPQFRKDTAQRYYKIEDQLRSLAAGFLLGKYLNVKSAEDLRYNEYGKPFLVRAGAPFFSLSHAGNFAALAVGETEIGVDIEPASAMENTEDLRLWTAREAAGKALGLGLWEGETWESLPTLEYEWLWKEDHLVCVAKYPKPSS
jgi:phosphopantetheinyl transferase